MLLTGGSAVVSSLTGVPTAAACFLLPLGVVIYTMFGGIKATFLTDYVHTVILLVIILTFAFTTYATGDRLGSPRAVYDALTDLAAHSPVEGNAGGSYLTMRSKEGAIFFVINIIGEAKSRHTEQRGEGAVVEDCKTTEERTVRRRDGSIGIHLWGGCG